MALLIFIVILIVLVWVHELGHFSAAKLFGIRVDEFSIGFPPRLFSVTWGETRYSFNLLLVGGYVSIHGESGEANDPRSITKKSRPVQAAVIVAGILFNIIFAWLVMTTGYLVGLPTPVEHQGFGMVTNAKPTVSGVLPGSPAEAVGMQPGDILVRLQTATDTFDLTTLNTDRQATLARDFLVAHQDQSVAIIAERSGKEKDFIVKAADGFVPGRKAIGVELDDVGVLRLPLQLAVLEGGYAAKNILWAEASGLGGLVAGLVHGGADLSQVSGPIGIVSAGSQFVAQGFAGTVPLIALISLNLALVNLIPIPGLDGGRFLFIAIESVLRRPLRQRTANLLTLLGFAFIVMLMLAVSVHDVSKLLGK